VRLLVTGGAGYIGAVTAEVLLDRGHEVVVLDDLRRSSAVNVPARARLERVALEDEAGVRRVLGARDGRGQGRFDACLHFAASIEAGESMRAPERFFANNTAGTLRLLDWLVDAGVERFVLSSTAAVYGEPRVGSGGVLDEGHPTDPANAYGESKLLVERALAWLRRRRGLRCAVLRYFNAAGATDRHGEAHDPETHLIPLVLAAAAGERPDIAVFGTDYPTPDGTAVRDYVHVADLAAAHALALERLGGEPWIVCNLGGGRGASVREVIASAERVSGRSVPVREEARRDGDPAVLVASSGRARALLGWTPEHGELDDIVGSAWAFAERRRPAPRA